ncbi:MAG: hypothetical protein IT433_12925 [Phycisphaerales bacterium]|nr:hypothetical protein [Phycisphaerales bacterium]
MKLDGGSYTLQVCPECRGKGSVMQDDTLGVRSQKWVRGGRVPCPKCKGKKAVASSMLQGGRLDAALRAIDRAAANPERPAPVLRLAGKGGTNG